VRKTTIAITVLSAALVVSNAAWLYALIDAGVSYTYLQDSYRQARETAIEAIALLPQVAKPGATRATIIAAALRGAPDGKPFEKDGFLWVNRLGLQFDEGGSLIDARPATDPL
jgi:hypothetical protein